MYMANGLDMREKTHIFGKWLRYVGNGLSIWHVNWVNQKKELNYSPMPASEDATPRSVKCVFAPASEDNEYNK